MRVLIVSENAAERARAASMLRPRADVDVVEADTARAAKAMIVDSAPFDVLVVDGNLAPQGGYSFLYELRADAEQHGGVTPPSLVLTTREQDTWLAGWAHADRTLPLPADPFAVARAVDELATAAA